MIPPSGQPPIGQQIDKLLTHDFIDYVTDNAGLISCWDFHSALGNTIRDKYESFLIKIVELTNVLVRKGAAGYFWIVTGPEVCEIFKVICKVNTDKVCDYFPMGTTDIMYEGTVNSKWRLYNNPLMEPGKVLIGVNATKENPLHYARMSIANFII